MINHLTDNEHNKVHEITGRLAAISSPVLRLQAILQYSQIVDILTLGDTAKERMTKCSMYIDELENKIHDLSPEKVPDD